MITFLGSVGIYLSRASRTMKAEAAFGLDLSHRQFLMIDRDYEQAAAAVDLIYVRDNAPGIVREPCKGGFLYFYRGKPISDQSVLDRIKKLAVPPAWRNVWICPSPNGHVQATGLDVRNRKQYRYHTLWSKVRSETKFHRLFEFGKALPMLRQKLEKDICLRDLCERKVLAAVILLMERTYIRVGNQGYEKMNGSYGLTTLKDKHVSINGGELKFSFKGKKGIFHDIRLQNKKLANIVKQCRDIPGKELFQYYGEDGARRSIDSGMVNEYIKEACGIDFTAKDFRLWAGSLNILRSFNAIGQAVTATMCKQNVLMALDQVSRMLGNTRTVCRKYYVHPGLIRLYEENNLQKYLKDLDALEKPDDQTGLTHEERVLMKILKQFH